ncbi:CDP-diacylglycerol---glycerol-3-phosphate 3-phosphatidyltransferase [Anaerolineae bacterium]|nr:CDP-diacylglycerol---glycerol-3-phosphate 3-phosphatidyltransferase [Anaerolineae bacterium]
MGDETTDKSASLDRRPIAARRSRLIQRFAAWLATRRVAPNSISLLGMIAGISSGICLAIVGRVECSDRLLFALAAILIQTRLVANLLDGLVAVEGNLKSAVGDLYNEVPDRVSDTAVFVGAGLAAGGSPALGWAAACAAALVAYSRVLGKSLGFDSDYRGPMAKQHRMFVMTATMVFLVLAPVAWRFSIPVPAPWPTIGPIEMALFIVVVGAVVTALRRLSALARKLKGRAV